MLDVACHLGGGSGSKGKNRTIGLYLSQLCNLKICRTEVMSPLTDTMCFIDSNKTDLHMPELGHEDFR